MANNINSVKLSIMTWGPFERAQRVEKKRKEIDEQWKNK